MLADKILLDPHARWLHWYGYIWVNIVNNPPKKKTPARDRKQYGE